MPPLESKVMVKPFLSKNETLYQLTYTKGKQVTHENMGFDDMLNNPIISKTLSKLIPILGDILELRRLESDTGDTSSYLSSLTEIELYINSKKFLD